MWGFSANKRLRELEESVARLKRQVEERDLDWVDMRARCKRLLDRTEKAARAVQPEEPVVESPQAGNNGESTVAAPGRALSPHQMSIQQAILRRRAGL